MIGLHNRTAVEAAIVADIREQYGTAVAEHVLVGELTTLLGDFDGAGPGRQAVRRAAVRLQGRGRSRLDRCGRGDGMTATTETRITCPDWCSISTAEHRAELWQMEGDVIHSVE